LKIVYHQLPRHLVNRKLPSFGGNLLSRFYIYIEVFVRDRLMGKLKFFQTGVQTSKHEEGKEMKKKKKKKKEKEKEGIC
jgi:hypothetical protein